jgi:hypothetical protein
MTDSPFGPAPIRSDNKLDAVIEEARRIAEANERAELAAMETFIPTDLAAAPTKDLRRIVEPVVKLYTAIFVTSDGELDFDTLPAEEIVEKYLATPSKKALFLDWSRRCVPGDMTSIGVYLVVRKADA